MAEEIFPLNTTDIRLLRDLGRDASASSLTAHDKLDTVQSGLNEVLTDTTDIQPRVVAIESNLMAAQTDLGDIETKIDAIQADIDSPASGLDAIATKSDAVKAVVDTIASDMGVAAVGTVASTVDAVKSALGQTSSGTVASHVEAVEALVGTPANGTVAADLVALDSRLSQIQNNTRTVIALNTELEMPAAGQTKYFKILLTNYDSAGNMEEPDSAPVMHVETQTGTSRDSNVGDWDGSVFSTGVTMQKISDGRYYIFYRLTHTAAANEQLVFTFTIVENALTRYMVKTAVTVEEISSTFTGADRALLGAVNVTTTDVQSKIGVPANITVSNDIAAVKTQTTSIENKVDTANTAINLISNSDLPAIRTKLGGTYDRETMSLEAISAALAVIGAPAGPTIWDAAKTSGNIAASGNETVVLGVTEGMQEYFGNVNTITVNPVTSCTNYAFELYEDVTLNSLLARVTRWNSTRDGDLTLVLNRAFLSPTAAKNLYVKVINNSAAAASFSVKVRVTKN